MSNVADNPAVIVAGELSTEDNKEEKIVILAPGVRARLHPVTSSLILAVTKKIEDPKIPRVVDPDKGREIENPMDPAYLAALQSANQARGEASSDAAIMFGIELLDPLPNDGWEKKLKFLGVQFDEADPLQREMAWKKYIAAANDKLKAVLAMSGMSQQEVSDEIAASFPDKPKR